MKDQANLFIPGAFYHVYNRANGHEKLFLSDENYRFFLRQYNTYVSPVVHTYCYCLMPNHFHFFVGIKEEEKLEAFFIENTRQDAKEKTLSELRTLTGLERSNYLSKKLSLQFSHLFNSYTQAFNKIHSRRGGLFMRPFKRKQLDDENYLLNLVRYIHQNPVDAGLCFKPEEWEYSSYHHILNNSSTLIDHDQVIEWFDDKENFIFCHQTPSDWSPEIVF